MSTKHFVILCPVGVSLKNNVKNSKNLDDSEKEFFKTRILDEIQRDIEKNVVPDGEERSGWSEWGSWQEDFDKFLERTNWDKTFPPAEYSSIFRWLKDKKTVLPSLTLHLLPTRTDGAIATAYATQFLLAQENRKEKIIETFEARYRTLSYEVNSRISLDEGIGKLFKAYDDILPKAKSSGVECIINMTGGYKVISAYSVLYAQIHELASIYTYEGKDNNAFELLPLPISYALDSLDEVSNLVQAIYKGRAILQGYEKSHFQPWIKSLIDEQSPKVLVNALHDYYEAQRKKGGAYGSALLDVLREKEEGSKGLGTPWYDYLKQCIAEPWSELWLGDQIPETVEHSRRHSKRLMELASYLFRAECPQLKELGLAKPFSLALLISAIYLHDIGHTAVVHPIDENQEKGVFPLGLFPSCVREVHHLLSAELMRKNEETLFPVYEETSLPKEKIDLLRILTPLVSEHHRGYTRLSRKQGAATPKTIIKNVGTMLFGEYFEETCAPLQERIENHPKLPKDSEFPVLHVLRVAALLRVLDGCDVQADRTVNENYIIARLERTKEEAKALWRQLRPMLKDSGVLQESGKDIVTHLETIESLSCKLTSSDSANGTLSDDIKNNLDDACKKIYSKIIDRIGIMYKNDSMCFVKHEYASLVQFYSLINRYAFKWEQFLHFYKHRCVAFIMPLINKEGDPEMLIWPAPRQEQSAAQHEKSKAQLEDVRIEIENEYNAVKEVLFGLTITVKLARE